jgi:site-specific recombinase XerD
MLYWTIFSELCRIEDSIPIAISSYAGADANAARHAMGKHIIEKTGNVTAVQRQLGHKNAVYSMQYARISDKELEDVLEQR